MARSRFGRSCESTVACAAAPAAVKTSSRRESLSHGAAPDEPPSHPQKDLPAIHPGKEEPEHEEDRNAFQQRLEAGAEALECAGAEVGDESALDEALPEMGN